MHYLLQILHLSCQVPLREMSNFVEFTRPWYSTTPGESQIGTRRVREREVSKGVMFLTPMSRRVRKNHGLGTSSVACQGKSGH